MITLSLGAFALNCSKTFFVNDVESATDEEILNCIQGDANKLLAIRNAVVVYSETDAIVATLHILAAYEE